MHLVLDLDYTTLRPCDDYHDWSWYNQDGWEWLDFPPMDGAVEAITHLHEQGHDITFVTARAPHPATHQWLLDHGLSFAALREGTSDKWSVPADLYLDDSPTVLAGLRARRLSAVRFLHPHNEHSKATYTVRTWPEFVELVGKVKPRRAAWSQP